MHLQVLIRCDLNVPLDGKKITDDTRIRASVETIKYLVSKGARVAVNLPSTFRSHVPHRHPSPGCLPFFKSRAIIHTEIQGRVSILAGGASEQRADLGDELEVRRGTDRDFRARLPRQVSSHLGRPKDGPEDKFSLAPCATRLTELLGQEVKMAPDCVGDKVKGMVDSMKDGDVILLENVRFYKEEEKNVKEFAEKLAAPYDLCVSFTPVLILHTRASPCRVQLSPHTPSLVQACTTSRNALQGLIRSSIRSIVRRGELLGELLAGQALAVAWTETDPSMYLHACSRIYAHTPCTSGLEDARIDGRTRLPALQCAPERAPETVPRARSF